MGSGFGYLGFGEAGYGFDTGSAHLEIWNTGAAGYTEQTKFLWGQSADAALLSKEHDLNQPQRLTFFLQDGTPGLTAPVQGNRVRVTINAFGDFFTGYLTSTPQRQLIGGTQTSGAVYGYKCVATDETQRLEWKAPSVFPTLPPFLNMTQGAIIRALITKLGGGFDLTGIDAGVLIPYFRTSTSEGFWQAVRRLCDNTQAKFWTANGKAYMKVYADTAFGYDADESLRKFVPDDLVVNPVQNQIYNDVIGFGEIEPTTYCRELFVGDGLTASFTLKKPLYTGNVSQLFQSDWTDGTISDSDFNKTGSYDVDSLLGPLNGSLKLFGGTSVTPARLSLIKGIEMSGTVEARSGRFNFFKPADAIIGAFMAADTGLLADVVFGFRATKAGDGFNTVLQPIVNGVATGPMYTTKQGLTYQLTITVDSPQLIRTQQKFFSRDDFFGGATIAAGANASFLIEEVQNFGGWQADTDYAIYTKIIDYNNRLQMVTNDGGTSGALVPTWPSVEDTATVDGTTDWVDLGPAPVSGTSAPVTVMAYTASISTISEWLYFMLIGGPYSNTSSSALFSVNFTLIHTPVYLEMLTKVAGASVYTRARLGDKNDLSARAGITTSNGVTTVQFFQDVQPQVGEWIRYVYRAADIARARIQEPDSIASEALNSGDDGIRAGILPKFQTSPRNSVELELAIQAYIDDHTGVLYQGSWDFNTRNYTPSVMPVPGRFITINVPTRQPSFSSLVTKVTTDFIVKAGTLEFLSVSATFGPLYRFDEIQKQFQNPDNIQAGAADTTVPVTPVQFLDVGASHAADRDSADWDNVLHPTIFELDAGAAPDSVYEVRKSDEGWGTSGSVNLIETPDTQTFSIPRNAIDTAVYIKNRTAGGLVSRYPAMVRIVAPLVPDEPTATFDATDPLNVIFVVDPAILLDPSAYGYEIRDSLGNVLHQFKNLALQKADLTWTLQNNAEIDFTVYVYAFNLLGEYSDAFRLDVVVGGSSGAVTHRVRCWSDVYLTHLVFDVDIAGNVLPLGQDNLLRPRWFEVIPDVPHLTVDDPSGHLTWSRSGTGGSGVYAHTYTPQGVDEFLAPQEVYMVPFPTGTSAPITVPVQFASVQKRVLDVSRRQYVNSRFHGNL